MSAHEDVLRDHRRELEEVIAEGGPNEEYRPVLGAIDAVLAELASLRRSAEQHYAESEQLRESGEHHQEIIGKMEAINAGLRECLAAAVHFHTNEAKDRVEAERKLAEAEAYRDGLRAAFEPMRLENERLRGLLRLTLFKLPTSDLRDEIRAALADSAPAPKTEEERCTCHSGSVCGEACRQGKHHGGCSRG